MSESSHIIYRPHPGTTSEQELEALATVYRFVLCCQAEKQDVDRDAKLHKRKETPDESLTR